MPIKKRKFVPTNIANHLFNLFFSLTSKKNPCSLVTNEETDMHTILFRDEQNKQTYLLTIKPFNKKDYEKEVTL